MISLIGLAFAVLTAGSAPSYAADVWTQVSPSGFGSANNASANRGATFFDGTNTDIYYATQNSTDGAQIWRTANGTSWTQQNASGFDVSASSNQSVDWLANINSVLYAGVSSPAPPLGVGGRIYRSPTGANPWTLVFSTASTGNPFIVSAGGGDLKLFNGNYYMGAKNPASGAEIWKSATADTTQSWVQVSTAGFGEGNVNSDITFVESIGGALYAGTGSSMTSTGQLWRSADGLTWTQVLVASKTFSANTQAVSRLVSFNGYYFIGTLNSRGTQLWKTADLVNGPWTQVFSPDGDGTTRFSVASSSEIHALGNVGGSLWAGTGDPTAALGARVYRSTDGAIWTLSNVPGFGSPTSQTVGGFVSSGTWIYASTRDNTFGGAVWRTLGALPNQPTLSASALGVSSIAWSWGASSNASGFRVVSSTGGNVSGDLPATTLSWTATNLSTNTAYVESVVAFNGIGNSTSAATTRSTLANAPSGSSLAGVFGSSLTISWNANTNPAGTTYQIQFWASGRSTSTLNVVGTNGTPTGLSGNTTYFVDVLALNGDGIASLPDVTLSTITQPQTVAVSTITPSSGTITLSINTTAGIATVSIPANSFSTATAVTVQTPASLPATSASAATTLQPTGIGIEIDLNPYVQPSNLVSLKVPYTAASVAGLDPSKLILARFDDVRGLWVPLASTSDTADAWVTATSGHLSLFQIMAAAPPASASQMTAFPNPLRPALGQTVMTFSNAPANARIRIYTLAGELVKDIPVNASGVAGWDATNRSGAPAASGVYFALVQGAGQSQTYKVAIER